LTLDPRAQFAFLRDEWRQMLRPESFFHDFMSGIAVALVALPLSLAIANASGVEPRIGLVTAIVGGIVVALFGGSRFQVSGPAAAMTFLVYEIISKYNKLGLEEGLGAGYGLRMLIAATLLAGLIQLASGIFRLGRFMQFIPRPVVAGFLSGIGITIFCTQLPKVLGYDVPHEEEGGALGLFYNTVRNLDLTNGRSLAVGALAAGLMIGVPRISRRLPAPLIAVVVSSLLPVLLGWTPSQIQLLGEVPNRLPVPVRMNIPWEMWNELAAAALTIYFLASLESLLSASVVDAMVRHSRGDHDQELVGQGLGNIASSIFGGIPVTGVIARSATNIQSGARSRLSAILHALILLLMMLVLGGVVSRIPIAALAGVLIAVSTRMIEVHVIKSLWKGSRLELAVYLATAGTILVTDLIIGVPVGIAASFAYVVLELSKLSIRPVSLTGPTPDDAEVVHCPVVNVVEVEGPLFFASGFHLRNMLAQMENTRCLVLDLSNVPFLDVTGAETLEESIDLLRRRGVEIVLAGPDPAVRDRIRDLAHSKSSSLAACGIYDSLRDALLHAAVIARTTTLCHSCRESGTCRQLTRTLESLATMDRTDVPSVRAVIGANGTGWKVIEPGREEGAAPLAPAWPGDSRRVGPPSIDLSAYIDPRATVLGNVTVCERVWIGPGASARGESGAPLCIGPGCIIRDGAVLHAPPGRVILVKGQAYGIYLGNHACVTHQALIHGPTFLGDHVTIGLNATIHDSLIGDGSIVGLSATVVGVSIPGGRFVPNHAVIDSQEAADRLPEIDEEAANLRESLQGGTRVSAPSND
jgi:high affinity sulfate transporter 1